MKGPIVHFENIFRMLNHALVEIETIIKISEKYKDTVSICDCLIDGNMSDGYIGVKDEIKNETDLKKVREEVITLAKYETNYESNPQAILQAYTLWIRPTKCYEFNVETIGNYITKFCFQGGRS